MNSCKFRFLGLVVTTLFITSLIANPMEITKKDASSVIKQSELKADDVSKGILGIGGGSLMAKEGEVVSKTASNSLIGIDGGSLTVKEGGVVAKTAHSSLRLNDRADYIINNDGRPDCPDGYIDDCSGDGDCCPESWIGDGFADCEDQAYGCDLTCYDNDGGDCDGGGTTTTTTGGGNCDEVIWSTTMTYDWYCTGSPGSAALNLCANGTADLEGYSGTWASGLGDQAWGDGLCPGASFDGDLSFNFDNYATAYVWDTEGDDIYTPGSGYHDDQGYNGADNADGLTCVNGGDCAGGGSTTTGGTTTGGDCPDGYVEDCVDDDCCPESWIGDGFEDCEDQAYGCDLTCYDNDGGDCGDTTTTTTTTTTGGGDAVSFNMTYDWYCSGSPGSAQLNLYPDGSADLEGFTGTWMADGGEVALGDGLCPGAVLDADLSFMFDNYATVYIWDQYDQGMCSDGDGWHDDQGYNGENVDGATSVTYLSGECGDTDPCDGQAAGDANADGTVNVLDVVSIVNYILAGGDGLDDCGAAAADYNGDGTVNVLDVVGIVNLILSGGGRVNAEDATNATMVQSENGLNISGNGYIGGVQMTLSHGADFSIDSFGDAYLAEYKTVGNTTTLIVINPEGSEIFKSSGDYAVDEVLVATSDELIDVTRELPVSFSLSNAYPNPFNPTTTLTLDITDNSFASVKVFNLKGEVVGVLMNDMVDAGSYTVTWDGSNLSSGVYMIRAEASGHISTQKVMLVK